MGVVDDIRLQVSIAALAWPRAGGVRSTETPAPIFDGFVCADAWPAGKTEIKAAQAADSCLNLM